MDQTILQISHQVTFDHCIPLRSSMLVDGGDEVFKGVVYTLSRRFEVHFDLGRGGRRFQRCFDIGLGGKTARCIMGIDSLLMRDAKTRKRELNSGNYCPIRGGLRLVKLWSMTIVLWSTGIGHLNQNTLTVSRHGRCVPCQA